MTKRRWILSSLLLLLSVGAVAQSTVRGYVFEDLNGNGTREAHEPGVANVGVSNGVDVVMTDAQGRYTLPVGDDTTIFVIKPAGYSVPVDEDFIPQYFYHHKPLGLSDGYTYPGIPATGALPEEVSFPLQRMQEPEEFSVLLFGDPQPYSDDDVRYFGRAIVDDVKLRDNTLFGIALGDIVGDTLPLNRPYKDELRALQLPFYHVMGNHDMNFDAPSDELSDEYFQKEYGLANTAFNVGKVHFIILDDIIYPRPDGRRGYTGGYREDQLEFVKNDLKHVPKDHLIVISQHIHLKAESPEDTHFRHEDRVRLLEMLEDYPRVLFLSAHTHLQMNLQLAEVDGWKGKHTIHEYNVGTTSGDWYSGKMESDGTPNATMRDGTPQGYAFLNIKDNDYTLDYKVAGKPDDYQIELYHTKLVPHRGRGSYPIFANFFMGCVESEVEYRVDEGEWRTMNAARIEDPSYVMRVAEWDNTCQVLEGRRPSNPVRSTHVWRANLDKSVERGLHKIEVRATDRFGRTHTATSTYSVY